MPCGTSHVESTIDDGYAKLSVFVANDKMQFVTSECYFYQVERGTGTDGKHVQSTDLLFTDVTATFKQLMKVATARATKQLQSQIPKPTKALFVSYMHRYALNADTPREMQLPIIQGIALLKDGLMEWSLKSVAETFVRCVHAAKMATQFSAAHVADDQSVQTAVRHALYAMSLRMFAGSYQSIDETVDDRTLPFIQFYSNHDCDDLAMAALAMACKLEECTKDMFMTCNTIPQCKSSDLFSAWEIMKSVKSEKTFMLLQGVNGDHGHTWAAIKCKGNLNCVLHIEATRLCTPMVCAHLTEVFGEGVFAQPHKAHSNSQLEIAAMHGVSIFVPEKYGTVCAVYTDKEMRIVTHPDGDNLKDVYDTVFEENDATVKIDPLENVNQHVQTIVDLFATPTSVQVQRGVDDAFVKTINNQYDAVPSALVTASDAGFVDARTHKAEYCYVISPGNNVVPAI